MSVRITRLDNGLRVATDTMETVETVTLGAWIETGARDEPAELNGISHLVEHMLFKGTERRSARDIAEEIEAVGGHLNAYTSRENTAYYAKVLRDDVHLAIDVISDLLLNATLDETELEREKSVICQEIHQAHDTPDDVIFDHLQEIAYPGQALGRPVLGTEDVVRSLGRAHLTDYLSGTYTAPSLVFCAAGRVDHDALVDIVGETFGGISATSRTSREFATYQGGEKRIERDLEQVHVVLALDGIGYKDEDFYAASVLSTLFGGGMSSRLFQEVREERGLAYSIYSFLSCCEDSGLFGVYAGTGADQVGDLMPIIANQAIEVTNNLTPDETERARAQLKANILMARESTSTRAEQLARQLMLFDRSLDVDEIVSKIEAVDEAAVKRAAQRIFSGMPAVSAIGPLDALEPFEITAGRFVA